MCYLIVDVYYNIIHKWNEKIMLIMVNNFGLLHERHIHVIITNLKLLT